MVTVAVPGPQVLDGGGDPVSNWTVSEACEPPVASVTEAGLLHVLAAEITPIAANGHDFAGSAAVIARWGRAFECEDRSTDTVQMAAIDSEGWARAAALIAVTFVFGCDAGSLTPRVEGPVPSLRIFADVSATIVTGLSIDISAPDITPSLVYNLPVQSGIATGTVQVPAGFQRTFTLRAYDGGGIETHRGTRTVTISESGNPALEITLVPLQGDQQIVAILGSIIVLVSPPTDTTVVGGSLQLNATVIDSIGQVVPGATVNWATLSPAIAEVDSHGVVVGKATGTARIVATYGLVGGSAVILVLAHSHFQGTIVISPAGDTLNEIGATLALAAAATDVDGSPILSPGIEWSSLNPAIATVDDMGILTARAFGTAIITATAGCCAPDSATFVVQDTASSPVAPIANRFVDGLESALKDARDPNGLNVDGFQWTSGSGTSFSIVRDDGCIVFGTSGPINPPDCGFADRQWENAPDGTDGRHAARFRYPRNSSSFAEQRFDLGVAQREVWFRFWLRVPINFIHENVAGSPSSANNKLFSLWMDGYEGSGDGSTVWWSYRPDGNGGSNWYFNTSRGGNSGGGGDQQYQPFITYPNDQGRWMQIVFRIKASSRIGANDGVMESWRRWENEASFTRYHQRFDADINLPANNTPPGFLRGYFMGASNSWWAADTEFLIDRFEVSTEPLVPDPAL